MTRTMCWKEYREQCGTWLLLSAVGVAVAVALVLIQARGGQPGASVDRALSQAVAVALVLPAFVFALTCGARLLAGEQESRTLEFLDAQPCRRAALWRAKLLAGVVLCLAQASLFLGVAITAGVHGYYPMVIWLLPAVALDGLAWGLFGSALLGRAVAAACVGAIVSFWAGPPVVVLFLDSGDSELIILGFRAALAGVALGVSARVFSHPDRRTDLPPVVRRPRVPAVRRPLISGWLSLLWLTFRQGRTEAAVLLAGGVVLGGILAVQSPALWPFAAVALSTVCGVAVFSSGWGEGDYRFLGEQRLPPWRVWWVTTACWLCLAAVTSGLTLAGALARHACDRASRGRTPADLVFTPFDGPDYLYPAAEMPLVLAFAVLYGFAIGQLAGMVVGRRVLADVLALVTSGAAACAWLPSLVFGGVSAWQVLIPPLLLLVASRRLYWLWVSRRLESRRARAVLTAAVSLTVSWTAVFLLYRIVEIPYIDEPFDRAEFERSLDSLRGNEGGSLVRQAMLDFDKERKRTLLKLTPPPPDDPAKEAAQQQGEDPDELRARQYRWLIDEQLDDVRQNGWPREEPELGRFLDALFARKAAAQLRNAVALPLGLVEDPREITPSTDMEYLQSGRTAARLLTARALQLQARGNDGDALDHLLSTFALSRQVRNRTIMFNASVAHGMELVALWGMEIWLARVDPRRELISRALDGIARHDAERPPLADSIKANYLYFRKSLVRRFDSQPYAMAREVPWEKARSERLFALVWATQLERVSLPYWELGDRVNDDPLAPLPLLCATVNWENEVVRRARTPWARVAFNSPLSMLIHNNASPWELNAEARELSSVRALRLRHALTLYELDARKPAARLTDLVPDYLTELPVDPFSGRAFGYRVSRGERVTMQTVENEPEFRDVPAGEGILWSTGPDRTDHGGKLDGSRSWALTAAQWEAEQRDLIYLVPRWSK